MPKLLKNGLTLDEHVKRLQEWRQKRTRRKDPPAGRKQPRFLLLGNWARVRGANAASGRVDLRIPEVFSFIDSPNGALATLNELHGAISNPRVDEIYIDHTSCKQLDLCASIVMDTMLLRAKRQWSWRNRKVALHGMTSGSPNVNYMLNASGLLKQLGLSEKFPIDIQSKILTCDLLNGRASRQPSRSSQQEIAASRLRHYINGCLMTEGFRLNDEGSSKILNLLAEVLDNAEQHARTDGRWHIIGYFSRMESEAEGGVCNIVIFNFGGPLYTSLRDTED